RRRDVDQAEERRHHARVAREQRDAPVLRRPPRPLRRRPVSPRQPPPERPDLPLHVRGGVRRTRRNRGHRSPVCPEAIPPPREESESAVAQQQQIRGVLTPTACIPPTA